MANFFDQFDTEAPVVAAGPEPGNFFDRFDPSPELRQAQREAGDLSAPQRPGRGRALMEGVLSGASGNFRDELYGVANASGLPEALGGLRIPVGASRLLGEGAARLVMGDWAPQAGQDLYAEGRDRIRAVQKQTEEDYPYTSIAGQVAGAMAVPVGAGVNAPTVAARMARGAAAGGAYGAVAGAGAGEGVEDRAVQAATGGAFGSMAGAAAPLVIGGAELAGRGIGRLVAPYRGFRDTEGEAARRVVGAIDQDMRNGGEGLTPHQFEVARRGGMPVSVADMGDETVGAVARSAANSDPVARQTLKRLADDRFEGQTERAASFLRRLIGGDVDTEAVREGLRAQAARVNRPAYAAAMSHQNAQSLWDEGFQQIASAPVVQDAIRGATRTAGNRGAIDGFAPIRNPFAFNEAGYMTMRAGPNGERMTPNLAFWDAVKRNLDDTIGRLDRSGERAASADAKALRAALVNHLDEMVPEYQSARAGAARFFGAEDALSAGERFVQANMHPRDFARAWRDFSPEEQVLFRQGFAAGLIDRVNRIGDRQTILNKIAQTPEARQKIQMALGPQGARQVNAYLTIEHAMDKLRTAVQGNSTTARQLMELGLAGGTYAAGTGGDIGTLDPTSAMQAAMVYGLARGRNRIDQRVSRRVAEMLTSSDPAVLAAGLRRVSSNRRLLQAFRDFDLPTSRAGSQGAIQIAPFRGAAADQDQRDQ